MAKKRKKKATKLSPSEKRKRGEIAEELKGKSGVREPFAVATAVIKKSRKKRKRR